MKKGVILLISIVGVLLIGLGIYFSFEKKEASKNIYVVQFNTSGGSLVESQQVEAGSYISRPVNPIKEGYVFSFWKYNEKEYDFNIKVTSDMTLTAVWKEVYENQKKYTLSFDTNGGEVIDSIEVVENAGVISLPIPKREGYIFKNWQSENEFFYNSILVDKDMTLVAVWEKIDNNESSSTGDNIIGDSSKPDDGDTEIPGDKPIEQIKHVRLVDDLKIEVISNTVKFSKYIIDFSNNYDKNYYYSSVDGYEILKSSTIDGKYELITKTTASTFELKNANVSKDYYYAVRAYKKINSKTEYSDEMKIVYVPRQLDAPTSVFYKANENKISVTFDINDSNVQKYEILKKIGSTKTVVTTTDIPEASWSDSNYACYTVRGYSEVGNDVKLYGLESKEVCFKPILESIENINTSSADPSTGFDYKTTWDSLANRPLSYMLDVYRKDANGNQLDYIEEYIFSNIYLTCGFDNGVYAEIHVHGYDKTVSYELKGPPSTFYIR